ncbi:acyltransferase [Vibrio campbellii]
MNSIYKFLYNVFSLLPSKNTPDSKVVRLRVKFASKIFQRIGTECNIQSGVRIRGALKNIQIGDNSGIGINSSLHAQGRITIGNDVMIGQELIIHTARHGTSREELMRKQGSTYSDVTIGNNVWIGSRVTILPGVTVSDNIVIGAGSIVTKDCTKSGIYAGNPAVFIKEMES